MEFSYYYSEGTKTDEGFINGKTYDPNEVKNLLDILIKPKSCVSISSPERDYNIDFWCLDDGRIEMEIIAECDDKFACFDIPMAKQVVDVIFRLTGKNSLFELLQQLPVKWM